MSEGSEGRGPKLNTTKYRANTTDALQVRRGGRKKQGLCSGVGLELEEPKWRYTPKALTLNQDHDRCWTGVTVRSVSTAGKSGGWCPSGASNRDKPVVEEVREL